jgi:dTDP-4-amino-4,6-dideoxygalactose transaminase
MITVTKTPLPDFEEYERYLRRIWETGQLTNNGEFCVELARRLKARFEVENLEVVGNGTLALQLAIRALGVTGEVITTPYSYVATTNAILWEGCRPVFVDIEPDAFCINPDLIEAAITDKTSAILATHVYGYPCDVARIRAVADRHGLKVVYDAAHAFDVKVAGHPLVRNGDCSTLSFHATKIFHSAEGGAVICEDPEVARRTALLAKFGHLGEDEYLGIGINAKLSELHAAMGLAMLPRVDALIASRRERFRWYDEHLQGCALQRPKAVERLEYNYAYYPVLFPTHAAMMRARSAMFARGIIPRRYFSPSLNTLPFLAPELKTACPVSEDVSERVLVLPVSYCLAPQDARVVADIVKQALR